MGSKSVIAAIVCLVCGIMVSCASGNRIFNDLHDKDGITRVYVNPMVIKLGLIHAENIEKSFPKGAIQSIKDMEVIDTETLKASETVKLHLRKKLDKLGAELILENTDGEELNQIYGVPDSNKKSMKNLIFVSQEDNSISVVNFSGKFNPGAFITAK